MMANFWHGNNIKMRAVELEDAETIFAWNQDSERARSLEFIWPPSSMASIKAWLEEQGTKKFDDETFSWIIENKEGVPVGGIATHKCTPRYGTFSYGIDIACEHRRRGYAAEAIQLILNYYFDELRYQKVTVGVYDYNEASIALHQKLGFQKEGTHRRIGYTKGHYVDMIWFGMTVEEFRADTS